LLYTCQVRRLIEGEAARRAAGRIPVADLQRMRKRYLGFRAKTTEVRATEIAASRDDLHRFIAESCGNPELASIIVDLKTRSKFFRGGVPGGFVFDEHFRS